MSLEDVFYIARFVSQSLHLVKGCFIHIPRRTPHAENKIHRARGAKEVARAQARINKDGSLICLDQDTGDPIFNWWKIWPHGSTIEKVDRHKIVLPQNQIAFTLLYYVDNRLFEEKKYE